MYILTCGMISRVFRVGEDQDGDVRSRVKGLLAEREGLCVPAGREAVGEAMIKDFVILPLVSPNLVLAYRKNVSGVRYSACCNLPTFELSRQ
jgi:hypothetical protein